MRCRSLGVLLLSLLGACAPAGPWGQGRDPLARSSSRNLITRVEIEESHAGSAHELVRSLRPEWLHLRGLSTLGQAAGAESLVIYLNNARLGVPETMREVSLGPIEYLRFFSAPQATQRWGGGHLHGAILISTEPP